MQGSIKAGALIPVIKQVGQTLALLGVLALFGLMGAGVSVAHSALNGRLMAPGPSTTPPPYIAASNGDIIIGTTVAATTGNIHVGNGG